MAGHSKWANIKHRKGKADAKRGKIFSRIAKEIITAVKLGGSDAKNNPRLRLALLKARDANMPNDNIDRNIKKASSADQADYHEMTYELYGHGGVGIVVDVMTDNKNRISSEMRIATNKKGGTVATPGAVTFNFDRKGVLQISKKNAIEDELFLAASEAGAEDFEAADEFFIITTDPAHLYQVKEAINHLGFACEQAELEMIPKLYVECDVEIAKENLALIDWLEELEDVDAVYHNMKIPEELEL
ncbi:MAG: YebC/PmpR family DNA-binding transcriptional regulator [Candidatus Protochlamydia sp.]|nr:YebC/PmpR family DNA-binding transcriptional regulator [Candidatus Protochlamydia sp.]